MPLLQGDAGMAFMSGASPALLIRHHLREEGAPRHLQQAKSERPFLKASIISLVPVAPPAAVGSDA
jgi:hypothetical protein